MIVHPCPVCGRAVNRQGEPFDEPHKTRAHIDGAHDEEHRGERGGDYMEQIRENTRRMDTQERQTLERGGERAAGGGAGEVEVALGVGETMKMPVERAVKLNATRIADPEGFGIASQGTAWEIRQENKQLREELETLRERIATLESEVADLSAEAEALEDECPNCGGELRIDGEGGGTAAVCEECGKRVAG